MKIESDSDLITASACIIMMTVIKMMRQDRGHRRFWVRPLVQRRERMGAIGPPPRDTVHKALLCVVYFATSVV